MMDRFSVARCCCEQFCEDCCNGNSPTEWDVDIQYTDEVCTACNEDASGVFTLARTGGICRWTFRRNKSGGWNPPCVADYATYGNEFISQDVVLSVRCISPTKYAVNVVATLQTRYETGVEYNTALGAGIPPKLPGDPVQTRNFRREISAHYYREIDFTEFTCDEQIDFEVPFVRAETFVSFEWYDNNPFQPGWRSTNYYRTFYSLPVPTQNYPVFGGGVSADWYIDVDVPCNPPANVLITGVP